MSFRASTDLLERVSISPCCLKEVETRLNDLFIFLSAHEALVDAHLTSFFTNNLWETHVPVDWRIELESLTDDQLTLLSTENCRELVRSSSLVEFMEECQRLSLTCDREKFLEFTDALRTEERATFAMSEKKRHEVNRMTDFLRFLTNSVDINRVIDVGSGRGYLSESLALNCRLKVVGLDSKEGNTHSAEKRNRLVERNCKQEIGRHISSYLPMTETVDAHSDDARLFLDQLSKEHPGIIDPSQSTALVGLHTCGQLSCTTQELFLAVPQFKLLCYIGCCYHLESDDRSIFPQSLFLKGKHATLSKTARNYCQTARERMTTKPEVISESVFYRAALQWIVEKQPGGCPDHFQVGKLYRKCDGFVDYVEKALRKNGISHSHSLTAVEIRSMHEELKPQRRLISRFRYLQTSIASCVESVILLDRLCFLLESESVTQAFIIPLFDDVISPRNKAIVAFRT